MSPLCKIKGTGAKNDVVIGPAVRLVSPTRRHDGSLILPEGTLGRLQAHNLRAPKSQMSLARTKKPLPLPKKLNEDDEEDEEEDLIEDEETNQVEDPTSTEPRETNLFAGLTLIYLIEEGIRCLMHVEDVDSLLRSFVVSDPSSAHERHQLLAQRHSLLSQLTDSLDLSRQLGPQDVSTHVILKFVDLPLGRLLLYRALRVLAPYECELIIYLLMLNASSFLLPSNSHACDEEFVNQICTILGKISFPSIINYFSAFFHTQPNYQAILRTKRGSGLFKVFIQRGHYVTVSLQNGQHQQNPDMYNQIASQLHEWRRVFEQLAVNLVQNLPAIFSDIVNSSADETEGKNENETTTKPSSAVLAEVEATAVEEGFTHVYEESQESKIVASSKPPKPVSREELWELFATVTAQASPQSRQIIVPNLSQTLQQDLDAARAQDEEPSPALNFLAGVCFPNNPNSNQTSTNKVESTESSN